MSRSSTAFRLGDVPDALRAMGLPPSGFVIAACMLVCNVLTLQFVRHDAPNEELITVSIAMAVTFAAVVRLALAGNRLASTLGAFAILLFNLSFSALQSLAGLAVGMPLIDRQLAQIDSFFGIDHHALIPWFADYPALVTFLLQIYAMTTILVPLICLLLIASAQRDRTMKYLFIFSFSLALTVIIATLIPAVGSFEYFGLTEFTKRHFPHGSGIYHLESFNALRGQEPTTLSFFNINGIVTFPSFHTTMGLLLAYGTWTLGVLRWPGVAISLLTVVSCIPIGGHYVIDLVAGAAVFALAHHLSCARDRNSRKQERWLQPNGEMGEQAS